MAWLTTDDNCEIYYETHGQGPPVVFVSGFMGIADIWHNQIEAMKSDYKCIVYDRRGYGRSSKPQSIKEYTIQRHVDDLTAVLAAANVTGPVVLFCHSMGGEISMAFSLANPGRVKGMIRSAALIDAESGDDTGLSVDMLVQGVSSPSRRKRFYENFGLNPEIAIEASKWPLHALEGNAHALVEFRPGEKLNEIHFPMLVVHGDSDVVAPFDKSGLREEAESKSNVTLEVFKGVNHFPQTEEPQRFNKLAKEFLARVYT